MLEVHISAGLAASDERRLIHCTSNSLLGAVDFTTACRSCEGIYTSCFECIDHGSDLACIAPQPLVLLHNSPAAARKAQAYMHPRRVTRQEPWAPATWRANPPGLSAKERSGSHRKAPQEAPVLALLGPVRGEGSGFASSCKGTEGTKPQQRAHAATSLKQLRIPARRVRSANPRLRPRDDCRNAA